MSILIKGMEIPKRCYDCRMLEGDQYDGFCHAADKWMDSDWWSWYTFEEGDVDYSKPVNCPLVPVPPHGRLIDADAYEELLHGLGNRDYRREKGTICDAIKFLHPHYSPTVIEAETEGSNKE